MNKDCPVCSSNTKSYEILFESNYWIVTLAPHQSFLGKCYVSLRNHKASLSDLNESEWHDFGYVSAKVENAAKTAFGATMFNWTCLMNDAYYQNNTPNPHVHWHVRPRYSHSVEINGHIFTDEQFGRHYRTRWDGFKELRVNNELYQTIKQQYSIT